jgi:catechol 2,3-dioxygenase-like lactoylglutathione lyase family enzyme
MGPRPRGAYFGLYMANAPTIEQFRSPATSAKTIDARLEVVIIPVSDVERSKRFYLGLGWRLDADFANDQGWRVVQLTPPGSSCSIFVGKGITDVAPGSVHGTFLVVDDIQAARSALVGVGVDVSPVFHFEAGIDVAGTKGRLPGPDPQGRSYSSWVSFSDPDGNTWMMQEITGRLPGRGVSSFDVATLIEFLKDAEQRHGKYEPTAAKHHWSAWYSAYLVARQRGLTPEEAAQAAARFVESGV